MNAQLKLILAATLLGSAVMAVAEDAHHPADAPVAAAAPGAATQSDLSAAMNEQMQKMQAAHDKAAAAKTPAERQAAMREGMAAMKESWTMMSKQPGVAGCMGMGSGMGMGMTGTQGGTGTGMGGMGGMDMMMKMMDQQSSMMDMPMQQ